MPLTPENLKAAYEYLRGTPPYRSWGLPRGEAVRFRVTRHKDREGDHNVDEKGRHVIRVSARVIGGTNTLMVVMAHEMLHVYQESRGVKAHHNPDFYRLAERVCRYHCWDAKQFVGAL